MVRWARRVAQRVEREGMPTAQNSSVPSCRRSGCGCRRLASRNPAGQRVPKLNSGVGSKCTQYPWCTGGAVVVVVVVVNLCGWGVPKGAGVRAGFQREKKDNNGPAAGMGIDEIASEPRGKQARQCEQVEHGGRDRQTSNCAPVLARVCWDGLSLVVSRSEGPATLKRYDQRRPVASCCEAARTATA